MTKNFEDLKWKILKKLEDLEYIRIHYQNLYEFDVQYLKPLEEKVDDLYYFIYLTKIDELLNLKDKIEINWMYVFNDYNINNLDKIIKQAQRVINNRLDKITYTRPIELLRRGEYLYKVKHVRYELNYEYKTLLYKELLENENFTSYDDYKFLIHSNDLYQVIIDRLIDQLYTEEPYKDDDIDEVNERAIDIFEDYNQSFKDLIELQDLLKVKIIINK